MVRTRQELTGGEDCKASLGVQNWTLDLGVLVHFSVCKEYRTQWTGFSFTFKCLKINQWVMRGARQMRQKQWPTGVPLYSTKQGRAYNVALAHSFSHHLSVLNVFLPLLWSGKLLVVIGFLLCMKQIALNTIFICFGEEQKQFLTNRLNLFSLFPW